MLIFHQLNLLRPLEWKSWDLRLRLFSRVSEASKDIVLIAIDQDSLDFFERQQNLPWPWPRELYGVLVRYLKRGGAKACFMDLILSETSRYGVEDDKNMAEAMSGSGNVFLPLFLSKEESIDSGQAGEKLKRFSLAPESIPQQLLFPIRSVTLPVEAILEAAHGVGNVQFAPDSDAIYRRLPLAFRLGDLVIPSLPLALADYALGKPNAEAIPHDESGQMILRYHGPPGTYRTYSIAALINSQARLEEGKTPQVSPKEFEGKIAIVGGTAPGLLDLRPSPLGARSNGMEILATATDNILNRNLVRLPSRFLVFGEALVLALMLGVGISVLKKVWTVVLFSLAAAVVPAFAAAAAFRWGYWLDFVSPEFGVVTAFLGASFLNYSLEGKQRRFIKGVFRHYLSPHVIEEIIKNPSQLRLGGEKREISSFFSDVAGFTTISEGLSPEALVDLLNGFLSEMTDIILDLGGTLDKYEGDAIIAFWNAPLHQPDHAVRACRAALRCQKRLAELRPKFLESFGHSLSMRIGLNSGPAVVGNMGSSQRFDYTAMGDTVNLAARLESACKQYKIPILVGEATCEGVRDSIVLREVDLIRVVGKKKPIHVYQILGEADEATDSERARMRLYANGISLYRNREWEKAIEAFQGLGDDELARLYSARARRYMESPPAPDWDGVYDLLSK